jgi:GAF domain-containing protein
VAVESAERDGPFGMSPAWVGLRALMAGLARLVDEPSPVRRMRQLLDLSVRLVDAEHAVLVLDDADASTAPVLSSTTDDAVMSELRTLLGSRLPPVGPPGGPTPSAGRAASPAAAPEPAPRPVLEVPTGVVSGRSGQLYLVGRAGRTPFNAEEAEVMGEFMEMAGMVVENALRAQQSEQQVRWLRGLALVTQALLQPDADELAVWQQIADLVHQLARARTVTISMISEDDPDLLEVRVAAGVGAEDLTGRTYRSQDSLAALATDTGTWQSGHGTRVRTIHSEAGPPVGATLAIPLVSGQEPRGAVVLSRHPGQAPFDPTDVVMAHDFANQVILAVELAETRAAEQILVARTTLEEVTETFQDRTIQRLYAASLHVETALARQPEPWLTLLHAELAAVIADARSTLHVGYGQPTDG